MWRRIKCWLGLTKRIFVGYTVYHVTDEAKTKLGTYFTNESAGALQAAQMKLMKDHFDSGSRKPLIVNLMAVKEYEYSNA